jgi:hypothetical protein
LFASPSYWGGALATSDGDLIDLITVDPRHKLTEAFGLVGVLEPGGKIPHEPRHEDENDPENEAPQR